MGVTGSIVVYIVVWWLVFFAVLPWGVRHDGSTAPKGADRGAPVRPHLARKALVTSVIAAVIWAVIFLAVRAGLFDFYPEDWSRGAT